MHIGRWKSNVIKNIIERKNEKVLLVVDGAAFGPHVDAVVKSIKRYTNYALYTPESFEWLLLNSGIFKEKEVADKLSNPSEYIDSRIYFSWEQFFTDLLIKVSKEHKGFEYAKEKLVAGYTQENMIDKILKSINKMNF